MLGTGSFGGWTRAARMFVALTAGAAVLVAAIAVRGSAARSTARPQPMVTFGAGLTRLHLGPLAVCSSCGSDTVTINLAVTNLTTASREAKLAILDQDGAPLSQQQMAFGPQRSKVLVAPTVPAFQKVRGRLVSLDGRAGGWALSLSAEDEAGETLAYMDNPTRDGFPESAVSTALFPIGADDELAVMVANLGGSEANYRIRFFDKEGEIVARGALLNVAPRSIRGEEWRDFGVDFMRAVVIAPSNAPFLAAAQSKEVTFTITIQSNT